VSGDSERPDDETRRLSVRLDSFVWQALELEGNRLGVSEEELAGFAIAYYLADVDSGRLARAIGDAPKDTAPRGPQS